MAVDLEVIEHRLARKDDPHTMGPVTRSDWGFRFYHRECSCGWNLSSTGRESIMAAAKKHRALVAYYRRMARKEAS